MNIYKKCKIVMLPTNKEASNLIIDDNSRKLFYIQDPDEAAWGHQHLYILSDDKIQVGEWCLNTVSKTVFEVNQELIDLINSPNIELTTNKKIIASTDPKLNVLVWDDVNEIIAKGMETGKLPKPDSGGLPRPSKAFIQKYVELRGIDEIMVQFSKEIILTVDPPSGWKYGFPKQAPLDRTNILKWFVEQGYPQSEIDALGNNFTYGCNEYPVEILKVSKNNTIIIKAVEVDNQKTIDHILESACGYGMAETDEGKKAFTKCMNSIPKVHFDDFIYTLSRIAEKSGAGGFKNI